MIKVNVMVIRREIPLILTALILALKALFSGPLPANLPVSSDPQSFHQVDVDVSYEDAREKILSWKPHDYYFKWVKIRVFLRMTVK